MVYDESFRKTNVLYELLQENSKKLSKALYRFERPLIVYQPFSAICSYDLKPFAADTRRKAVLPAACSCSPSHMFCFNY